MPPLPRWLAAGITVAACALHPPLQAGWQDDIGLTRLRSDLGSAMPDGGGVPVTLVEATQSGNYLPQAGVSPITGSGNLSGKVLVDASGQSTGASSHAGTVANYFFGNNLDYSMAPGVTDITVYQADDFSDDGFLNPGWLGQPPAVETGGVQNHSWIGSGSDNDDVLRRFDFAIDRDGFVACVGLNNYSGTTIPRLMASAYNAIAVGRSDGSHSSGTTPDGLDGPGRTKPDLVVPVNTTSWATAVTSSAAALLLSTPEGAGQPSEVIKAVLLAGADKSPFPDWNRTPTRPLDDHFGAGQLHIGNSHAILAAGEQEASEYDEVGMRGWDYLESLGPDGGSTRYFSVPVGFHAEDLSVVLAWNRSIEDAAQGPAFVPEPRVHDFALSLHASGAYDPGATIDASDSPVDNVEHLFVKALGSGQWAIRVSGDSDQDHAIAWRATLVPDPVASIVATSLSEADGAASITVALNEPSPLPVEIGYTVAPGSAEEGIDYLPLAGVLVIPVGSIGASFEIPVLDDLLDESDEQFTVRIKALSGAVVGTAAATVTLIDDDPMPALILAAAGAAPESGGALEAVLALSAPSGRPVELEYEISGGTASAGVDLEVATGTVTIPAGSAGGTIPIPILDDAVPEADETVVLTVSAIRNATFVGSPLVLTIVDDDFASVLENVVVITDPVTGPALSWPAVPGRRYTVQVGTDLVTWENLAGFTDFEIAPGTVPVVTFGEPGSPRCFARVIDVTPAPGPSSAR